MAPADTSTIIVFSSSEDIGDLLRFILEREGYSVIIYGKNEVSDPALLPAAALIILDEYVPGKLGTDWCRQLKAHLETRTIPLLLLSVSRRLDVIASHCEVDGYLSKPFDVAALLQKIREMALTAR